MSNNLENYEERYNQALEIAKHYHDRDNIHFLEHIFPELKESEDERIRKELLDYLKRFIPHHDIDLVRKSKVWIAWLEKQGEKSWSEDDEKRISRIADFIWKNRKGDTDEIYQQEQDVNWLKSLKSKKHWKPSEEQMQALFEAKLASTKNREYFLGLLYEDLKKL